MFDLDDCTLEEAERSLAFVQSEYDLGDIYVFSDKVGSYRAVCLTCVSLRDLLSILLDTRYLDWVFFDWAVRRKKATIRTGPKVGRPPSRMVSVLRARAEPPPESFTGVVFDTGIIKKGISLI